MVLSCDLWADYNLFLLNYLKFYFVLVKVLNMDVDKALQTYQIEYMVLKEEMSEQGTESEPQSSQGKQLEGENKELQKQNTELSDQLQVIFFIFYLFKNFWFTGTLGLLTNTEIKVTINLFLCKNKICN